MTPRESEIIGLVKREVKPALGCTEPIAVALAAAKAVEILTEQCPDCRTPDWRMTTCFGILVEVSGNILKNGMGVGIPGTGMVGLQIAAALGVVCGKSSYGLEVLHEVGKDAVYTLLLVVSPLLFVAMFIGLLVGLFQTLTQLQEMTLIFVPKILLVFVSMIFLLPFMMERMRIFTEGLFDRIVALGY